MACLIAAVASWLRGGKYVYQEEDGGGEETVRGATPIDDTAVPVLFWNRHLTQTQPP